MYKELNLTREDNYKIIIPDYINNGNVFLVNANNYLCGIFHLEKDLESKDAYFLTSKSEFFRIEDLTNNKFSLLFFKDMDAKFVYNFYNITEERDIELYPYQLDYYKVDIENFELRNLESTTAILCIDFGTTNTAIGAYLDQHYVRDLPTNDILNGNIKLNSINYVKFYDGEKEYKEIYPTLAYVEDCSDSNNIQFLFGYDVLKKLESNDYVVTGTLFYGLKKWVHEHHEEEKIVDEFGNIRYIKRQDIIKAYLEYIVKRAEYIFKCKFKQIHASSPVKLKSQFLDMFQELFTKKIVNEDGTTTEVIEYEIIRENAMDEAIAVLYNTIETQIERGKYIDNQEYSALIIDCGGGTTDLAACKYKIANGKVSYDLKIRTSFENGDENFGGNNLTYRLFQFLKVLLTAKYTNRQDVNINSLIGYDTDMLSCFIER